MWSRVTRRERQGWDWMTPGKPAPRSSGSLESVLLSVPLSFYVSLCPVSLTNWFCVSVTTIYVYLSLSSVSRSLSLSLSLSISRSLLPSLSPMCHPPSLCLAPHLSVSPCLCLSLSLSVSVSVCLCVCLSVCLPLSLGPSSTTTEHASSPEKRKRLSPSVYRGLALGGHREGLVSAGAGEAGAVEGRRKKREGGSWGRKGTPTLGRGPGHLPAREPAPPRQLSWSQAPPPSAPPRLAPSPLFSVKLTRSPPLPLFLILSSSLLLWPRFRSPCSFCLCPPFLFFLVYVSPSPSLPYLRCALSLCLSHLFPIPSTVPSSFSLRFFVCDCDIVTFSYFCAHCSL